MHANDNPLSKAKPIPNWLAHVRRLVEGLGEGEVSIEVVDHQVTNIEVEELTSMFNGPVSDIPDSSKDHWANSSAELPERYKN